MAETYIVGETKVRPGAYFNIQKTGNNAAASIISGVTAVIFKSDFGPLNQAVELNAEDGYADTFGTGGTTDAMQEAINGGAKTIIACRVLLQAETVLNSVWFTVNAFRQVRLIYRTSRQEMS